MRKFFDYFKIRISILWINAVNTYQEDVAYFMNTWGNLFSTVFWTFALLIFIEVLYSNINMFAGYGRNEMLFLILMCQLGFYIQWLWSRQNLISMYEGVRGGSLDFVLTKPLPANWYVSFKEIRIIGLIRDGLPCIFILSLIIKWKDLSVNCRSIFFGIVIFILGQIIWHCFEFLFILPVFWYGESKQISGIAQSLINTTDIPFEGFEKPLKWIFSTLIPTVLVGQLAVSVILNKSDGVKMFLLVLVVTAVFLALKMFFWNLALKNYTSASS
ncbi:MAG: ABC-2 family transporter protein [bacterium]